MQTIIQKEFNDHIASAKSTLNNISENLENAAKICIDCLNNGGKIETLIEAAEKTQLATWNRLSGKTKRDKVKAQAQKEAEKKRRAAEKSKGKKIGVKAKSSTSNASRLGL